MQSAESSRLTIVAVLTTTAFFLGLTLVEIIPEVPVDIDAKPFFIPLALVVLVPWGKPVLAVAIGGMAGEFLRDMLEGYEPDDALGAVGYVVGFAAAGYLVGQRPLSKPRLAVAALVAAALHAVIEASALILFDGELLSIAIYSAIGNVIGDGVLLGLLPLLPVVPLLYGRIDRYLGYEPRGYEHYGSRTPAIPRPRFEPLPESASESPTERQQVAGAEPAGGRGGPAARPVASGAASSTAPSESTVARIDVDNLSFRYPATEHLVLDGVSFQGFEGELLGLVGPPGAGKTTLCMAVAGLVPGVTGGELSGSVSTDGAVGIVFEDPVGQLTQLRALSEVTDPLRTRGASRDDADREGHRLLERVGLGGEELADRWVWELSEGQQMLLALAATLATQPEILILDTVMGSLDATHRAGVLRLLRDEAGTRTVVLVEQDAVLLGEIADRLVVLDEGRVQAVGAPGELLDDDAVRTAADLDIPGTLVAARRLRLATSPLTTTAFRAAVSDPGHPFPGEAARPNGRHGDRPAPPWSEDRPRVQVRNVDFAYPDRSPVLRGLDLEIRPGEVHAVLGHTGAGKSTIVRLLCGLLRPVHGTVAVDDQDATTAHPTDLALRVATVLQDADRTLSQRTVREEIALSLRRRGRTDGLDDRVDRVRRLVGLPEDVLPADPLLLPRPHRMLVALAAALVVEPTVVVLDSPASGLSPGGRRRLAAALSDLRSRGVAVLITEHDTDLVVDVADTVTILDRGTVASQGPVHELLRSTRREELAARRIDLPMAGILADAVGVDACTMDELVAALSAPASNGGGA